MDLPSKCLGLTRAPSGVSRRQTIIVSSLQSAGISSRLLSFAGLGRASVDVKEKSMRFTPEKSGRSANSFDLLLQWIRGMGGRVGDIRVVQDDYSEESGYGLYATEVSETILNTDMCREYCREFKFQDRVHSKIMTSLHSSGFEGPTISLNSSSILQQFLSANCRIYLLYIKRF